MISVWRGVQAIWGDTTHVGAVGGLVAMAPALEAHISCGWGCGGLGPIHLDTEVDACCMCGLVHAPLVLATARRVAVGHLVARLVAVLADEHVGWSVDCSVGRLLLPLACSCCFLLVRLRRE